MPPGTKPRLSRKTASSFSTEEQASMPPPPQSFEQTESTQPQPSIFLNGAGLWRSWTRSFNSPLLALLEIFDNAVDAANDHDITRAAAAFASPSRRNNNSSSTLQPKIQALPDDYEQTSVVIRNSCTRPIPPLSYVLKLYNSSKSEESIGENGIGIKQACASLSNLSIILTKSNSRLELGILMKELQTEDRFVAPQCTFSMEDSTATTIDAQIRQRAREYPATFGRAFTAYGAGNQSDGIELLVQHFHHLKSHPEWKYHDNVFCVILSNLRHSGGSFQEEQQSGQTAEQGCNNRNRSTRLLQSLKEELPRTYLHIDDMDVTVNDGTSMERIRFQYWEQRLVELSKFEIKVDPKVPFYQKDSGWLDTDNVFEDSGENGGKETIRIFLGFDPIRLCEEGAGGCPLYIHSRWSGRSIKSIKDCRRDLGLDVAGTGFAQGLTVIVDDNEAALPLNPTKQDVSFGSRSHGHIHEHNFMSWVAGVVHFYWNFHFTRFGEEKTRLTDAVKACHKQIEDLRLEQAVAPTLGNGNFTTYSNLKWTKNSRKISGMNSEYKHTIRVFKSNFREAQIPAGAGEDTWVKLNFSALPYSRAKQTAKRKKNTQAASESKRKQNRKPKKSRITASSATAHFDESESEDEENYKPRATSTRDVSRPSAYHALATPDPVQSMQTDEKVAYENKIKELQEKLRTAKEYEKSYVEWRDHAQKLEKKVLRYKEKIRSLESSTGRSARLPQEIKVETVELSSSATAANGAIVSAQPSASHQSHPSPVAVGRRKATLEAENADLRKQLEQVSKKSELRKTQIVGLSSQLEALRQEKQMIEAEYRTYRSRGGPAPPPILAAVKKEPEFVDLCNTSDDES